LAAAGQPLETLRGIEQRLRQMSEAHAEPVARSQRAETVSADLRLGDRVRLPRLGTEGVVTELGLQEIEVQIGRLRVRARLDEVVGGGQTETPTSAGQSPLPPAPFAAAGIELDVRGLTADEALAELDRRLDAAVRADVPFLRIIHGKGTGRLRQAIRQALKESPYVASVESVSDAEGGDGVTRVKLVEF
jgi:DNA mismatch repair protein MutS2